MANEGDRIQRFTASERTIHVLLFASLIILSITGLTLKYHESWPAQWIIRLEGGVLFGGKIHRLAAIVLIGTFLYHILTIMFTRRGIGFFRDMMFQRKDFSDGMDLVRYNLGLRTQKPLFDRFTCIEKFQYWAVGIAIVFLGLSGFILWFETPFMIILPKWMMDLNRVIHSFEATVVFLILVVWHLYNVHLNPRVFPMNRVWLTGTVSKEDMKNDHPLEYQRRFGFGEKDEEK
jgi:formate dehydrogenase subunit gamma